MTHPPNHELLELAQAVLDGSASIGELKRFAELVVSIHAPRKAKPLAADGLAVHINAIDNDRMPPKRAKVAPRKGHP